MSDERPRRRGLKALMFIADVIASDGYGSDLIPDKKRNPRDFGRLRVSQWGKFARKHGLSYQEDLVPEEVVGDAPLVDLFADLKESGYPIAELAGLLRGQWRGVDVVGFHTYDRAWGEQGRPYRFLCTALGRELPDLVHDRALNGGSRTEWYPAHATYQVVKGAAPPRSGLLGRLLGPTAPRLQTAAPELAERFLSLAYRRYDERVFKYTWAVRGSWLVFAEREGDTGMVDHGRRADYMDAVPLVRRLVDQC